MSDCQWVEGPSWQVYREKMKDLLRPNFEALRVKAGVQRDSVDSSNTRSSQSKTPSKPCDLSHVGQLWLGNAPNKKILPILGAQF